MEFKPGDKVLVEGTIGKVDDSDSTYRIELQYGPGIGSGQLWFAASKVHLVPTNQVICDPTSPEAQALIGKEVYVGDTYNEALESCAKGVLGAIYLDSQYPFRTEDNRYAYIRAIEEKPIKKMTVSEVCKALGYDVEIVKDQQ